MRARSLLAVALTFVASGCGSRTAIESTSPLSTTGTGTAATGPATATSNGCLIYAADYDQSCAVDEDCAQVAEGDYCGDQCLCGDLAVISTTALAQFNADVSKTPVGSGAVTPSRCSGCLAIAVEACCRVGACTVGSQCVLPTDTLSPCADVGGACVFGDTCAFSDAGPANSCAHTDEICCLPLPPG